MSSKEYQVGKKVNFEHYNTEEDRQWRYQVERTKLLVFFFFSAFCAPTSWQRHLCWRFIIQTLIFQLIFKIWTFCYKKSKATMYGIEFSESYDFWKIMPENRFFCKNFGCPLTSSTFFSLWLKTVFQPVSAHKFNFYGMLYSSLVTLCQIWIYLLSLTTKKINFSHLREAFFFFRVRQSGHVFHKFLKKNCPCWFFFFSSICFYVAKGIKYNIRTYDSSWKKCSQNATPALRPILRQ